MTRTLRRSLRLATLVSAAAATSLPAQDAATLDVTGMLRTGLRFESSSSGGNDGFALYDARLGATGKVGIAFDYVAGIEVDTREENIRLALSTT